VKAVVYGIIADELGLASTTVVEQGDNGPRLRHKVWATPAAQVRDVQPRLPIDTDHNRVEAGRVLHLERRGGNLWAVGLLTRSFDPVTRVKVGDELVELPTDVYFSASRLGTPEYEDIVLDSVSLTAHPARVSAKPVTILDGHLGFRGCVARQWPQLDSGHQAMLERAAEAYVLRDERGDQLYVYDELEERSLSRMGASEMYMARVMAADEQYDDRGPPGPLRFRPARITRVR
jgi:hypothetical protein